MKLFGNLLLTVSLIAAMLSAATSYHAFLESATPDTFADEGGSARLKSAAGAIELDAEELADLVARKDAGELSAEEYVTERRAVSDVLAADEDEGGTEITAARLGALRDAGVETVFLKSFSFSRWRHGWVFLLAAAGLLTGSLMVRWADRGEIAAASAASSKVGRSPEAALDALVSLPIDLADDLAGMSSEDERLALILKRIDEAQRTHLVTFIDGRPLLVGRLGLGGYAELMDRFAAGERQLNRSWSAAADGVLVESEACLEVARTCLEEAQARLAAG